LIAAYTGCRRDEISSLMASDIKETDGVWCFDIRDGKTNNAERVVPIHYVLIDAGLLQYRDALPFGSRLFPSLKASASVPDKLGKALGYAYGAWRERLGIVRKGVNFHSFRHTVGDRLRKAGVAKDDRGFLLGHADVEMQNKVSTATTVPDCIACRRLSKNCTIRVCGNPWTPSSMWRKSRRDENPDAFGPPDNMLDARSNCSPPAATAAPKR
jgi:integrase